MYKALIDFANIETLDPKVFKRHGKLQEVIRQIGIHPMVGSNATPGAGYLVK